MPYTSDQIKTYARQLGDKGASPQEIEDFVASASKDMTQAAPALAPNDPKAPAAYNADDYYPASAGMLAGQRKNAPIPGSEGIYHFVKTAGLEGGGAGVGQVLGAGTGPLAPAAVPLLGGIGGAVGNIVDQATNPGEPFSLGKVGGAFVGGMVPGASLAKAGIKELAVAGAKNAATNLAAKSVETGIDRGELPSVGEAVMAVGTGLAAPVVSKAVGSVLGSTPKTPTPDELFNAERTRVLQEFRKAGGVIDPAAVDRGIPGMETIAGKEGMRQTASVRNARVVNRLVREDIGLTGAEPVTIPVLDQVRKDAGRSYEQVANISKQAANDLESLKQARYNARDLGAAYRDTGNPATRTEWIKAKNTADNIEQLIEHHAMDAGKPDLVKQLRADRQRIAKTYDIEAAVNPGNGMVDASVISGGYNGRNLTGNLKLVAEAHSAFPQYLTEPSRIGAPGVSRLGAYSAAQALSHGNPAGLFASGIPALGKPARNYLLSSGVQNRAAGLNQNEQERLLAAVARFSTLSAGRQNPFLTTGGN